MSQKQGISRSLMTRQTVNEYMNDTALNRIRDQRVRDKVQRVKRDNYEIISNDHFAHIKGTHNLLQLTAVFSLCKRKCYGSILTIRYK